MARDIPAKEAHDIWLSRLARAHRRLNRAKKAAQWAKWARLADMEDTNHPAFTEPARRDVRLDIIGVRPSIRIEACSAFDRHKEQAQTRLAEYELDNMEHWEEISKAVDDAGLAGIGWVRTTWYTDGPIEGDTISEADEQAHTTMAHQHIVALLRGQPVPAAPADNHLIHVAVESAYLSTMGLTPAQKTAIAAHIKEHESQIPVSEPAGFRVTRVHPANMLFDDTAEKWSEVEWVAERVIRRVEDVKDDETLSHTANIKGSPEVKRRGYRRSNRRGDIYSRPPVDTARRSESVLGPEDLYVVLWYIHDRVHKELVVVAEENPDKKPLLQKPWPYDDTTYFPLVFDAETDGIEGISDYQRIIHPCTQRSRIQSRWLEHLDSHSRRKLLYEDGFLDAKGEARLTDPNATLVPVKSLLKYKELSDLQINRDAYTIDDRMRENVNRALGVGEASQGVSGTSNSATEASIVDAGRGRVVKQRRVKVARMLEWIIRRAFNYYKHFGSDRMFLQRGISPENDIILDPEDITESVKIIIDNDDLSAANAEMERQLVRQSIEVLNASPWMLAMLGTAGRLEVLKRFVRSQKLLHSPDVILAEGALEAQLIGQMMPPEQLAARKAGEPTAGLPGQQTGNQQTELQRGAAAPGEQRPGPGTPAGGVATPQ